MITVNSRDELNDFVIRNKVLKEHNLPAENDLHINLFRFRNDGLNAEKIKKFEIKDCNVTFYLTIEKFSNTNDINIDNNIHNIDFVDCNLSIKNNANINEIFCFNNCNFNYCMFDFSSNRILLESCKFKGSNAISSESLSEDSRDDLLDEILTIDNSAKEAAKEPAKEPAKQSENVSKSTSYSYSSDSSDNSYYDRYSNSTEYSYGDSNHINPGSGGYSGGGIPWYDQWDK